MALRARKDSGAFEKRALGAKSQTLWLQSCCIHVFLIWTEVPFIQDVSGVYTSPFLDTDELKMAFWPRKVSRAFEKRAPGIICGTIWGSFAGGDHLRGCTVLLLLISSLLLLYGAVVIPRPTRLMVLTGRSFNKSVLVKYTTPGLYIWYSLLMSLWNTAYFPFDPCFWFIWYLFL